MKFTFKKELDKKCWDEYLEFLKINGSVWGITASNDQTVTEDVARSIATSYSINWTQEIHKQVCDFFSDIFKYNIPSYKFEFYVTTIPFSTYSENEGWIAIATKTKDSRSTICHEISHKYFYESLGVKLDFEEYNEIKEYLTVINNDLNKLNIFDIGYPQHKEVRDQIYKIWKETKSISKCVEFASSSFRKKINDNK